MLYFLKRITSKAIKTVLACGIVLHLGSIDAQVKDTIALRKDIDSALANIVSNPEVASKLLKNTLADSKAVNFLNGQRLSHLGNGVITYYKGQYASSITHYSKALEVSLQMNDDEKVAMSYTNIGLSHKKMGNYVQAINYYLKALKYLKKDKITIIATYNSIATLNQTIKQHHEAISNFKKALALAQKLDNRYYISVMYLNLAESYTNIGMLNKTEEYLDLSKPLIDQENNPILDFSFNNIYAIYFFKKNDYYLAKTYAEKAYDIAQEHAVEPEKSSLSLLLGDIYKALQPNRAEFFYLEGLAHAQKTKNKDTEAYANYKLYELYQSTNQYKKAINYVSRYIKLSDSIKSEKNISTISNLKLQYETEKKDNEINSQKLKIQEQETLLLKRQRQIILYSIIIGAVLTALAFVIVFYRSKQRLKQREIENLTMKAEIAKRDALMEGEEKERLRIAQDMHDGINGDLAAMKYQMIALNNENLTEKVSNTMFSIINNLDKSIQQVRNISNNLVPPSLLYANLIDSIRAYCIKMSNSTPTNIQFYFYGAIPKLHKGVQMSIYRIIQELINNIIKHANAPNAIVQISADMDNLSITVEDDGVGFDVNSLHPGLGLKNLKSRINFLNADLDITSDERGTTFNMVFHLQELKTFNQQLINVE